MLEVRLAERVEPRSTVLIVFDEAGSLEANQVYGKVDRIEQTGDDRIVVSIVLTTPLLGTERLLQGTR